MGSTGLTGALPSAGFWRGRRVLLTGHTGFKGAWLTLWLHALGAEVTGFASPPEPGCLADIAGTGQLARSIHGDVRDPAALAAAFTAAQPSVVLHLAAQALVRRSYADPVGTFATNVIGLVHLLEAARATPGLRAVVIVTSDKCYAPSLGPHRETDALGGDDPYSASKAAAELVAAAWRAGFGMANLATARAGNVIGGGDVAPDRLVPDCMRAWQTGANVHIRNPGATRPWQHVLDPLCGYLLLAEHLAADPAYAGAWNFGGPPAEAWPVRRVVQHLAAEWGGPAAWDVADGPHPPESTDLAVDATKARERLGWAPRIGLAEALRRTVAWHRHPGTPADRMRADLRIYA